MSEHEVKKEKPTVSRRIAVVVIWIGAALIAAELFYRFTWTEPPKTELVKDNHPIFHHVPNAFLKGGLGEYDFRGHKYEVAKKPGVVRVVFLGDSFTYSFTGPNDTIPNQFRLLLERAYPDTEFEVLNFGFLSYAPLVHTVVYRRLVKELQADYIIMLYDTFDSQEDSIYARLATFDQNGDPLAVVGEQFQNTGWRHSALVRFIMYAAEVVKNRWNPLPDGLRMSNRLDYFRDPGKWQHYIDFSFRTVKRLAARITRDGSRFVMFHYPPVFMLRDVHEFAGYFLFIWQTQAESWQAPERSPFGQRLMGFCKQEKLTCFDWTPDLLRMEEELGPNGSRLTIYNNQDAHFTAQANARFAHFIFEKMKKTGFPKPVQPVVDTP